MKRLVLLSLLTSSAACVAGPKDDINALRTADATWSKAFSARDLDRVVAGFAPEGRLLAPNSPPATTSSAIRKEMTEVFAVPDMKIGWSADLAYVTKSREIGYTSGKYIMSWKGKDGKSGGEHGSYVTVWKKQAGGWKVLLDTFASEDPIPGR